MQIIIPRKVDKFLEKQQQGDPKGIRKIRTFFNTLSLAENPTSLPNCKKIKALTIIGDGVWAIIESLPKLKVKSL